MDYIFVENNSYKKNNTGIYVCLSENSVETKFSEDVQDHLFFIEDTSWWFIYRAELICRVAEKFFQKDKIVVDIGGGNGFTTNYMRMEVAGGV